MVLTGPPGSSKSTCLRKVCDSLGFRAPLCWEEENPEGDDGFLDDVQQFDEFLLRAARYSGSGSLIKSVVNFDEVSQVSLAPQLVIVEVSHQNAHTFVKI